MAAEKDAAEAAEKLKRVEDAKTKKELEEAAAEARRRQQEMKEKKIRANLKVSIKARKRKPLKRSTEDFKKAKLKDYDGDLPVAEKLLKLGDAKDRKLLRYVTGIFYRRMIFHGENESHFLFVVIFTS